jgi:hypothetical protein
MTARSIPLVAIIAAILLVPCRLFAGGSIAWGDVRDRLSHEDAALVAWVEHTFDIRHSGTAARVGRQADGKPTVEGAQIGDRVAPYEFAAKPKGSAGDYTLYLTFDYSGHKDGAKAVWQVTVRRNVFRD